MVSDDTLKDAEILAKMAEKYEPAKSGILLLAATCLLDVNLANAILLLMLMLPC